MHFDFYPFLRINFAGNSLKENLCIWFSQNLIFENLIVLFGIYFLRLLNNDRARYKDILQDHNISLPRNLAFGNSVTIYKEYISSQISPYK